MTRILVCSLAFCLAAAPGKAQIANALVATEPAAPEKIKVIQLTVRPAAAPDPALRYHLLPGILDQTPGNAEPLYCTAIQLFTPQTRDDLGEKLETWLETPLKDLPRDEIRNGIAASQAALRYVQLASRREWCHWDLPIRTEGFSTMLPALAPLRGLARLLAVKARLEIAEGRYDDALGTLQTGFAMARHVGEGPVLIHSLVGVAIADIMAARVQELIQAAGPRNLYWALGGLPRPLIDLREALQFEMSCIDLTVPQLRNLASADLTPTQWRRLSEEVAGLLASAGTGPPESQRSWDDRMLTAVAAVKVYPKAKQYVISLGRTPQQVEAMPVQQVVMIYSYNRYARWRDGLFKWLTLPYWQAREGLSKAQAAYAEQNRPDELVEGYPFSAFLPALDRAYYNATKLDRRIAALRCIEAIRLYAAAHDGKPPASLREITDSPAPLDPITGTDFGYTTMGNKVTLEAPAPPGESSKEGTRYEITIEH